MGIFNPTLNINDLKKLVANTMVEHLGIEFTAINEDSIEARMPVDHRTHQPMGMLHGGASVALAETLGSVAATFCTDPEKFMCVGQEINANHIRSMRSGYLYGVAKPIHIGKRSQVWEIRMTDEQQNLICISRITLAVLEKK